MKIAKTICAVIVAVFMIAYMITGAALFAVDLSLDEKNIENVLNSSEALSSLIQSAELSINDHMEENAEEIVEEFGGDSDEIDASELYKLPETNALFAHIFTGNARYILYNEEYTQVDEKLVEDYLCAVAQFGADKEINEDEMEDYLSVKRTIYVDKFNSFISRNGEIVKEQEDAIGIVRFLFNDIKFIAMAASVVHMLILILLVRGKLGYYINAAVFAISGIFLLVGSTSLEIIMEKIVTSRYATIMAEIYRGRIALIGALLFAAFALFIAIALIKAIRNNPQPQESKE